MSLTELGELRSKALLANIKKQADTRPGKVGSIKVVSDSLMVSCKFEPVSTFLFLNGVQTETLKITHRVTVNFNLGINQFSYLFRDRIGPDQLPHRESYQVHRLIEDGQQILMYLDVEYLGIAPGETITLNSTAN